MTRAAISPSHDESPLTHEQAVPSPRHARAVGIRHFPSGPSRHTCKRATRDGASPVQRTVEGRQNRLQLVRGSGIARMRLFATTRRMRAGNRAEKLDAGVPWRNVVGNRGAPPRIGAGLAGLSHMTAYRLPLRPIALIGRVASKCVNASCLTSPAMSSVLGAGWPSQGGGCCPTPQVLGGRILVSRIPQAVAGTYPRIATQQFIGDVQLRQRWTS